MKGINNNSAVRSGFTIVELLIVIVVIAILAAISIVTYRGIQNSANDAAVQSDLRQSLDRAQIFRVEHERFPLGVNSSSDPQAQAEINQTITATRSAYRTNGNAMLYCHSNSEVAIIGRSKSGNGYYASTRGSGSFPTWPGDGSAALCPAAGVPTTADGFGAAWLYSGSGSTGYSWRSWFTGGQ